MMRLVARGDFTGRRGSERKTTRRTLRAGMPTRCSARDMRAEAEDGQSPSARSSSVSPVGASAHLAAAFHRQSRKHVALSARALRGGGAEGSSEGHQSRCWALPHGWSCSFTAFQPRCQGGRRTPVESRARARRGVRCNTRIGYDRSTSSKRGCERSFWRPARRSRRPTSKAGIGNVVGALPFISQHCWA